MPTSEPTTSPEARVPGPAGPPPLEAPAAPDPGPAPAPAPRTRIAGVDLARGLAVLGMFAAHTALAPTLVLGEPSTWGGVVHGRSSILFATLAGVSVALMSGRTTPPEGEELVRARLRLLVRAVCLFAVGGLVQLVSSPVAVILEYYAVLLVLCVPLLRWRPRRLLLLAGVVALVVPSARALWQAATSTSSWFGGGGELGMLAVNGTYPAVVWAAFVITGLAVGRLDLGAARVRRGLLVGGTALAVLGYGGSWALTQAFPSIDPSSASSSYAGSSPAYPEYQPPEYVRGDDVDLTGFGCQDDGDGTYSCAAPDSPYPITPETVAQMNAPADGDAPGFSSLLTPDQFLGAQAHSGTSPEVLGSGGVALAVLGASLVVADALARRRAGRLLAPLVAVGSMPLTAYSAHVAALAVTFHYAVDGSPAWLAGSWWLWALFAGAALVLCPLWVRLTAGTRGRGRGPLERLLSWTADRAVRP